MLIAITVELQMHSNGSKANRKVYGENTGKRYEVRQEERENIIRKKKLEKETEKGGKCTCVCVWRYARSLNVRSSKVL